MFNFGPDILDWFHTCLLNLSCLLFLVNVFTVPLSGQAPQSKIYRSYKISAKLRLPRINRYQLPYMATHPTNVSQVDQILSDCLWVA